MLLAVAVVLVVLIILVFFDIKKPHRFPPGPPWLPFVGNFPMFQIQRRRCGFNHILLSDLAKNYGDVVGFRLGKMPMVVVSGPSTIKQVLTMDEFDGRPDGFLFRLRTFGERLGIALSDGDFWKSQRKFCVQYLRKFGLGRKAMEVIVSEEAQNLVNFISEKCSTPISVNSIFDISVFNVLWALMAGERFSLDNPRLTHLINIIHDAFRIVDFGGGIVNQIPFLRFIAPEYCGYNQNCSILKRTWKFLEEEIEKQKKTLDPNYSRGFIDAFLKEMNETKEKFHEFSEKQLLSVCLDLLMAGSETTSNSLSFAIMYMLKYPDVQKKVQEEIDKIVGCNRNPTLDDKSRMPYTEAVIAEIQRISSVAPLGVPHRAMKDTELNGFLIPKDTVVIVNIYSVHMNEQFWKNPTQFQPERFINENGSFHAPEWNFIPFGHGKRRCLGEGLAKATVFLFFTTILHDFNIKKDPSDATVNIDIYDGLTLSPKPFKIIFERR